MSKRMTIVLCPVGEPPRVERVDGGLDSMQNLVGGPIELLRLHQLGLDLWCNEEGLYTHPFNRNIYLTAPKREGIFKDAFVIEVRGPDDPPFARPGEMGVHRIHGPFFFARGDDEGETVSLKDEDIPALAEFLKESIIPLQEERR